MVTESNRPFIKEFVALVCWCILTVVIDFIGLKFPVLRIISVIYLTAVLGL